MADESKPTGWPPQGEAPEPEPTADARADADATARMRQPQRGSRSRPSGRGDQMPTDTTSRIILVNGLATADHRPHRRRPRCLAARLLGAVMIVVGLVAAGVAWAVVDGHGPRASAARP